MREKVSKRKRETENQDQKKPTGFPTQKRGGPIPPLKLTEEKLRP